MDMNQFYTTISDIREKLVAITVRLEKLDDHNRRLEEVERKADAAEKAATEALGRIKTARERLDKIDKYAFWIVTLLIGAIVLQVLRFTFNQP